MNGKALRAAWQPPEVPEIFHSAVCRALSNIREAEPRRGLRGSRLLAAALIAALLLGTAAFAAARWQVFDALSYLFGNEVPRQADDVMRANLYRETVNDVEIAVREAGYDGRTLLVQYSYRVLDAEAPFTQQTDVEGILRAHGVGWWADALWIDGDDMGMTNNSGGSLELGSAPGEVIYTQFWRDIAISGTAQITLPIGVIPEDAYRRALYDKAFGCYTLPDQGAVTFTLDVEDAMEKVITSCPEQTTRLENGTAIVREAAFSPLMTYITLEMLPDPAAYKALDGEEYALFSDWLMDLTLVDGSGTELFPGHNGQNGFNAIWAEYLYPALGEIPDALWMAPLTDGAADMERAVRVK